MINKTGGALGDRPGAAILLDQVKLCWLLLTPAANNVAKVQWRRICQQLLQLVSCHYVARGICVPLLDSPAQVPCCPTTED